MQVIFNIKDNKVAEAEEAIAALGGYQPIITNPDGTTSQNPQNKTQFMREQLKGWVKNQIVEHRNRQAMATVANQDNDI